MAVSSKKVILFIVEGPTDEDALSPVLKRLFQNAQVRFHVVHGDISTNFSVNSSNAVSTVNDHIKMEMDRYYFSRNLEHVLHNDNGDLTDEQKVDWADQFANTYSDDSEGFVKFLSDSDFTVYGDYGETWRFIFDGTNSLHRYCNVHLIFSDRSSQSS
ncbi:MAG: hypothetical protein RSB58_09845 [Clostridium sp.]